MREEREEVGRGKQRTFPIKVCVIRGSQHAGG